MHGRTLIITDSRGSGLQHLLDMYNDIGEVCVSVHPGCGILATARAAMGLGHRPRNIAISIAGTPSDTTTIDTQRQLH